jgi:DNA/RNA endonuclease G (NUC1)
MRLRGRLTFAVAFLLTIVSAHGAFAQCVSLTTLGSPYTQNFDTLSNTAGSTTNNLTIPGWFLTESGGGARDNEQYAVDTGGSTTGDMFSYGAAASTERALGQLRSGTLIPLFGACFTNNTGAAVTSLAVAYNGEEWRLGTAGRTDQMNFEYSTNATDLVTGTWTGVAALNFVTPDTATVGAKNGNAAADRTALSTTVSSLNIPNGATFWIRWNDTDATGADDGLAIDDVSLTPQAVVIDTTPPAVISVTVPANGTYVAGQNLDFTINFSENVLVVGSPRIPITLNTGGTVFANYVSGTGTSALLFRYSVVTGNNDPDGITVGAAFDPNGGTIKDAAGNDALPTLNNVGVTTGVRVDAIAPTVSSSTVPANGTYVAGQNLDFTVSYSEPVVVTGVPYVGVTLNTGGAVQAGYVSGSGTATLTFRYTVVSGNSDTDGITVDSSITLNGGTLKDAAGNNAATAVTFASTTGVLVDAIAPSSISSTVPANGTYITGQTLNYSVTFTEPVIVIGAPGIGLILNTGGSAQASYVSGSGTATLQFQYTVASGNADSDGVTTASSISLNGGSIKDAAGNNAATGVTFASTAGVLVDGIAPTVTSIVRADADPTTAATLHYTVTFSEDVANVATTAFDLTATGSAGGTISGVVAVDAHTYTVTVSSATGEGTLRLDVKSTGTGITDIPGNPLNGGFTTGQAYTLDHVGPNVTSVVVPPNATYTVGQNLDFTVNFDEIANVASGTPRIAVTLNSGSVYASYVSGSGSTALLFRYTVVTGDSDPDGIVLGSSIDLNGATIRDGLGNDANVTLNSVGNTTGVLVDANAPSVQSVTLAGTSPTNAASVDFTVTFSQGVTGVDASDFALTTAGVVSPSITNVAGSGAVYTVTVNTGTGDGTIRLDVLNDGTIHSSTNNAPLGAPFNTGSVYTIDKTAPFVTSITRIGAATTNATSVQFSVAFSEPVANVGLADFTATSGGGITGATVTVVSGSGPYTVTVNTGSGDGTVRLDVNGGSATINDAAGNALTASFTSGDVDTIDKTAPTVTSITRVGAATTNATSVQFTVTFSEAVTNLDAADFTATTSGLTGASVTGVTGSGPYTVTVNTGSGNGTVRVDVNSSTATINDVAGNALTANFTAGDLDTIDKTAPAVQSIVKASSDPTTAASVDFTVNFSESVTGVDTSDFTITAPALTGTSVTNVAGSGATYTVTVATGNGSGSLRLDFTGNGSVLDAAGNSAASFTGGESYTIQGLPPAPTSLVATAGNAHVALTWNAVSGATTYNVKRSLTTNTGYSLLINVGTASYDDTSAVNGTTYFYKVSAINGRGEGTDSNEASATPASAPSAPGPVSVAVGDAKVILSWPAVVGATSYTVKRGTVSGTYPVSTGVGNVTTFTDSTVANGTTYFYVVTASSSVEGNPSAEVSATPNSPAVLGVVISQVYGGGGNAGATLKNDFVELFNRGTQTVSLNGWFVHYTSAASATWTASNSPTALSGTIAPGHYYLVQEGPGANGAAAALPTPDASGLIAMGATGGRVALVGSSAALSGCPSGAFIADFVGYGSTATCFEGTGPTGTTANTSAVVRGNGGCTDTNNNSADFAVVAQPLTPRNSASPTNVCGATNNPPGITAPADPIASVAQDAAPFNVNLTGADDGGVYIWSATAGTGIQNVTVSSGQSTGNVTYTVTLTTGFSGTAAFTASLSDGINPPATQVVHIQVTGAGGNNPPIITPPANPITTVAQDPAPFTVNLAGTDDLGTYNWSATPGTGVASVNVTGGQGTTTVTYTVALNAGFNGTATFTASLSDNVNTPATQVVNINVLPAGSTPNHVVISQLYGGGGNSGATYTNDFIELFNPTASPVNMGGWSVQYSPATNTGAFTGLQPIGGVIGPGEYFLISLASGGAVGSPLPTANIVNNSGFNMSGTTGKIALVSNGGVLDGPCATTFTDPDIIDFVGYGTANCNEGGTNAPTPSNTTSDLRKNGGNTDTNVNGNDFLTGTPNPRRTSPIQETGPAVVTTDPITNGANAPRDASIIVTFSELVDVTAGWYNINCSASGIHNDATVVEGAPNTWVITPNTNFNPAEQCSVTIVKDFVHDRDTDDSVPGTDTLAADYTWTFTVSTGTAPPYASSVHLTMGNPSNATPSIANPLNYLMQKPEMAISYNRDLGRPNWVSWHLTDEWVGSLTRVDTFRPDPDVPPTWYRVLASDFFASGFDRGHMTPNADRDKETSIPINQATFLMSNMVAQAPDNNQGPWANLENYLRSLLPANELYIVSGPAGTGGTGSNGGVTNTVANGHVTVPASTWKCALVLTKASGDDVARVTAATRTICVIMPNVQGIRNDDWHIYLKSVDQVETLSGYDLFSNVPDSIENAIEGGVDGTNPPGTANQSTSTNEDVAKSITLDAASPAGALTYTILTGPFNGTLTGSGANRTYTPAPNYYGTDTFTWRVNDGTNNSNTSTFTIAVAEVNDPPTAIDDSKTATANNALIFPSSDLTTNDSPGPANEAGQVLTVTAVTPTANTHGTVTLSSGQITYTPAAGYTGPASFTYTVCDNGTTAGSADPLCATATVNVTVNGQVTTHFNVTAPSNVTSGVAFNVTVTALDASNTTVPTYTGTVHFTSSSAGTLPANYTFVGGDNGSHTFSVTLTSTGAQSITATDTITASITGSANTTVGNVPPPPATHFSVTAPASVGVGSPFNVTVTALNASNGTATGYTGTVHFTSSSTGTLPADYAFVAGDNGTHTFSVTLTSPGSQTITATDTVTPSITGTGSTQVTCPPPPPPVPPNVSNSGPVCAGGSVNLFASWAFGTVYSWTGPGGFTSNQQNPTGITVAGTYTVTVSNPGPCGFSAQASTTVVINPIPTATISMPATVCALSNSNGAGVPNAGAGATYAWSITNGTITAGAGTNNISYTAGSSGTVHLSITVTSNGCSASSTADAAIAALPTITLAASIPAACGPSLVNVPFTLTGTGPWSIHWSDGITQNTSSASSSRNVSVTGSMVLSATVNDASSCASSSAAAVSITISSAPAITTQPVGQIVQPSQKATFTVVASGTNLHYQWFVKHANGATIAVGTDSPSYTTTPEGNAWWFVRVSNTCGSTDSDSVNAQVVIPRHRPSH